MENNEMNRHRNPLSWVLLLSTILLCGRGLAQGRSFTESDRIVGIYFFAWFTASSGQMLGVWNPVEGRQNWDGSVQFWERQIKDVMDANIDLIFMHLGNFEQQRINIFTALSELRTQGYQVPQIAPFGIDTTLLFGPTGVGKIDLCIPSDRDLFINQYIRFFEQYRSAQGGTAGDSCIAVMNGKPMIATWGLHGVENKDDAQCFSREILENELAAALGNPFNEGIYMSALIPPIGFTWSDEFHRAFVGFGGAHYLVDGEVSVLKPGFWDHLVDTFPGRYLGRLGGTGYSAGWDDMIASPQIKRLYIESWNEYVEGTGIFEGDHAKAYWLEDGFPQRDDFWGSDPRLYIDLTAAKAAVFNTVPELGARFLTSDTPPSEVDLGESFPITLVVRNDGDASWRGDAGYALTADWVGAGGATYTIDDLDHEIEVRDDPLFSGLGGYGGVFRGRPTHFAVQVTAPNMPGIFTLRWQMARNGTPFGETLEHLIRVGDVTACGETIPTTTVVDTLGIGAYYFNYFAGDIGEPARTADFICTWLGHQGSLSHQISDKSPGTYTAYKTENDSPNYGLLGNFGHGSKIISSVVCATSCGVEIYPTTVAETLGIGAYGNNCFAGDLGDPMRTADFICTRKGFPGALGFKVAAKSPYVFCAYKTINDSPNFGLSGNWGHGSLRINQVLCSP